MIYIISIVTEDTPGLTIEKCRANSKDEAIFEIKEAYGNSIIIYHVKETY